MLPFPIGLHVKICRRTWGVVTWESLLSLVSRLLSPYLVPVSLFLPLLLSLLLLTPLFLTVSVAPHLALSPSLSPILTVRLFLAFCVTVLASPRWWNDSSLSLSFALLQLLLPVAHLFTHIMQYLWRADLIVFYNNLGGRVYIHGDVQYKFLYRFSFWMPDFYRLRTIDVYLVTIHFYFWFVIFFCKCLSFNLNPAILFFSISPLL